MRSIIDYQSLFEDRLSPDEITVLMSLDIAYLTTRADLDKEMKNNGAA